MKSAKFSKIDIISTSLFAFFTLLFFTACGLDVYYILEPPKNSRYRNEDSNNATERFYDFSSNEFSNSGTDIYIGTGVFYRIYDNLQYAQNDITAINSVNSEYTENGYNKITSLGYKRLKISTAKGAEDLFIEKNGMDRTINIRLYKETGFDFGVKVDDVYITSGSEIAIPLRENGNTFDFFHNDDSSKKTIVINNKEFKNEIPVSEDGDFSKKADVTDVVQDYYIVAYAVSLGRTSNFSNKYSTLLPLGFLILHKGNY